MQFLFSPIKAFASLNKRVVISDAFFIVASVWIVLLGLQLSRLASADAMTTTLVIRSIANVTFAVGAGWFAFAGVGHLLATAVGAKTNFAAVITMTALAATPLALAGLVAIAVEMLTVLVQDSSLVVVWVTRALLIIGLAVGAPGIYFALGLRGLTKIPVRYATVISLFLFVSCIFALLLFGVDSLQL